MLFRSARIEARIRELEQMLNNIEIIDDRRGGLKVVKLGAKIVILDLETNEEEKYIIVGSVESDPLNGKLSNVTPLAVALMEHRVGDEVIVPVEEPYHVRILSID